VDYTINPKDRCFWNFEELNGPKIGSHNGKKLAKTACDFGSYFTTLNRGNEVPPWAPNKEIADAISYAVGNMEHVTQLKKLPLWCERLRK